MIERTNGDILKDLLDKIFEQTKNENHKILIARMKNDEKFLIDVLSFISTLCVESPSFFDELNHIVPILMLKKLLKNL